MRWLALQCNCQQCQSLISMNELQHLVTPTFPKPRPRAVFSRNSAHGGSHPCPGDEAKCRKPVSANKHFCAACAKIEFEKARLYLIRKAKAEMEAAQMPTPDEFEYSEAAD